MNIGRFLLWASIFSVCNFYIFAEETIEIVTRPAELTVDGVKYSGELQGYQRGDQFVLHGRLIYFYHNKQAYMEKSYVHGKLVGRSAQWYPTGELQQETEYSALNDTRKLVSYDKNGNISSAIHFLANEFHGPYTIYRNGKPYKQETYKNGKKHGLVKLWYPNGAIYSHRNVITKDGKAIPHGLSESWYQNGKLMAKSEFVNGVLKGLRRVWYFNGVLAEETDMNKGLSKYWDINGDSIGSLTYKNSKPWSGTYFHLGVNYLTSGRDTFFLHFKNGEKGKPIKYDGSETRKALRESKLLDSNSLP